MLLGSVLLLLCLAFLGGPFGRGLVVLSRIVFGPVVIPLGKLSRMNLNLVYEYVCIPHSIVISY